MCECTSAAAWKLVVERERDLIPLFGLGSTRRGKGNAAGEESAKFAALCQLVKKKWNPTQNMYQEGGKLQGSNLNNRAIKILGI